VFFKLKTLLTLFVVLATLSMSSAYAEQSAAPASSEAATSIIFEHENSYDHDVPSNLEGKPHIGGHGEGKVEQEKAGLPQLDPAWFPSQIFWLLVTFSAMYAAFSTKILPDISTTLENRREHVQNDLDTAEELKDKAEAAHQRYEELMSGAYEDSRNIVHSHDEEMKAKYNEFITDFRQRSTQDLAKLDKDLAKMKTKAKKDMNDMIADLATQAADKIAGVKADKKDMQSILDSLDKKAA